MIRMLAFDADGRYAWIVASRGVYTLLPADSIGSISREYARFALRGNTLLLAQDSLRTGDYMGGSWSTSARRTSTSKVRPPIRLSSCRASR